MDAAGPYQAIPQPGARWHPAGRPARYPHEHLRHGTAKMLTLFHPATGRVRLKGATSGTNAILHAWLKQELSAILADLPAPTPARSVAANRAAWEAWQAGLTAKPPLPDALPPLRLLLVLDNLAGHKTPALVLWLLEHGIMPLYTPVGGSWLNMTESIQRILQDRALAGQQPTSPAEIMAWLEAAGRGWNADPTPFVWGGKRLLRRRRAWQRHHPLGGSGACTRRPLRRPRGIAEQWRSTRQVTH